MVFGVGLFLRCFMKMCFRDPRPFMKTLRVYPNMCDLSYGTPDSEILLATLMIGVIFLNKGKREIYSADSTLTRRLNKFAWFLAIFIWLNILFCGVVNGLCTIDQTLFGLNLGILLAFSCECILRQPIDRHVTKLMNGEYAVTGYSSLMQKSSLLAVGSVLASTLFYLSLDQDEKLQQNHRDWLYNISLDCNVLPQRKLQFAEVELATSTFLFSVYGAYLGLIVDAKYY